MAATTVHAVAPHLRAFPIAVVTACTVLQVWTLRRATGEGLPFAAIPVMVFNAVGTLGYLFYESTSSEAAVSAILQTTDASYRTAALIFATASVCTWLGGLATARNAGAGKMHLDLIPQGLAAVSKTPLLLASLLCLVLTVIGRGPAAVLERADYLESTGPMILVKSGQLLLPLGLSLAAFVMFHRSKSVLRVLAAGLVIGYLAVSFSFGTRGIALMPAVLACAALAAGRKPTRRAGALLVATTWLLLQVPLALRADGGDAGLGPYTAQALADPVALFSAEPGAALGNVLWSVPLTGFVAELNQVTASDVLAAVNPMPSQFTGWDAAADSFRINVYTPFSGLGELGSVGLPCVALFFAALGALLSFLQQALRRMDNLRAGIGFLAGAGLTLLFSVNLLQYNLRLCMRLVWCLAAVVVALRLWPQRSTARRR